MLEKWRVSMIFFENWIDGSQNKSGELFLFSRRKGKISRRELLIIL